jgi:hypothetical protein
LTSRPFDAQPSSATLADIDPKKVSAFQERAAESRHSGLKRVSGGVRPNPRKFRRETSEALFPITAATRHGFPHTFGPGFDCRFGSALSRVGKQLFDVHPCQCDFAHAGKI